jgi:hypothetical protein
LGQDSVYPEYLNQKIIISNKISLIVAFMVALPFVFISLIFFPPLTYLPIIAVPASLLTLLFNFLRAHTLARLIICLVPFSLASVYQGYLSSKGEAVTPGLALIMLSFSFIIFVVFDIQEKGMLFLLGFFTVVIMLSVDSINESLEMELETGIIKTGYLAKMVTFISIICGWGCTLIFIIQNKESDQKALELVKQSKDSHDEMLRKETELTENLKKLESAQEEEKKRQWLNEGLAKGMIILRNQTDLKKMGDQLISFLVTYLQANQGGLFLLNNSDANDPYLELLAAYAYERQKFLTKRIDIGVGLLGQTYLEKETTYLKKVPEEYVSITSGLGDAPPRNLIIVPFKVNEEIPALVEIASFQEITEYQIKFLEVFGESIASHLENAKTNMVTQELLMQTTQQAEEMRAQEEEMRQNMEELSATQEEMSRKEVEYVKRIKELESQLAG